MPDIDTLAELVGFTATLRLAAWFGPVGYVDTAQDQNVLASLLGASLAQRLCARCPDQRLWVRLPAMYADTLRLHHVSTLLDAEWSVSEVAHWCGTSEQEVHRVYGEAQRQGLTQRPKRKPRITCSQPLPLPSQC